MKYVGIVLILLCLPFGGRSQIINELQIHMGWSVHNAAIRQSQGFSEPSVSTEVSLFACMQARKNLNERWAILGGVGISRAALMFSPFVQVTELEGFNNPDWDGLLVTEVSQLDRILLLPLRVSFTLAEKIELYPPFWVLPGVRLLAGIDNRITLKTLFTNL